MEKLENDLHKKTRNTLGLPQTGNAAQLKSFVLPWKDLTRWSVEFVWRQLSGTGVTSNGRFPTESLSSLCYGVSGGTPSTRNPTYWTGQIPWVSPKDMKSAELFDSQDHISQSAIDEAVLLVPAKSVLIVVRSGILQRTVPIAVNRVPVAINQDLRAYVPKDHRLLTEFLAAYLNSQQDVLLHLVKWSTTVQSINKEELDSFLVPRPPLTVQEQVIEWVAAGRAEISREREAAERLAKEISAETEAIILGSKTLAVQ